MSQRRRRQTCARCGRRRPRAQLVFSKATRVHYCGPLLFAECDRAYRRAQKQAAA